MAPFTLSGGIVTIVVAFAFMMGGQTAEPPSPPVTVPSSRLDSWSADAAGTPFAGPISVRCHPDGRIFVVDDHAHRISVFDRSGQPLRILGEPGDRPGQLRWPDAIHWDARGLLYVADTGANRIQVWNDDGTFLREFGRAPGRPWSTLSAIAVRFTIVLACVALAFVALRFLRQPIPSTLMVGLAVALAASAATWMAIRWTPPSESRLSNPREVLVGENGIVFVADFGSHRVKMFDADGRLVRTLGGDSIAGALNGPIGLARSTDGRLFVADSGNHRIVVFAADGSFLNVIGKPGSAPGEFQSPHGLYMNNRELYVTERGNHRIQILTAEGVAIRVLDARNIGVSGEFVPTGICRDQMGDVWIADAGSHRVLRRREPM